MLPLKVNVVKAMVNVLLAIVVVNMDGVVKLMNIVLFLWVVNPNLVFVQKKMLLLKVNVVKAMESVPLVIVVVNMDGVVNPMPIVPSPMAVKINLDYANKFQIYKNDIK